MRHIRTRIEAYAAFGHETLAYLDEQKKARPELAGLLCRDGIAHPADRRSRWRDASDMIQTPEYATGLADEFRTTLLNVDYEGDDALAQVPEADGRLHADRRPPGPSGGRVPRGREDAPAEGGPGDGGRPARGGRGQRDPPPHPGDVAQPDRLRGAEELTTWSVASVPMSGFGPGTGRPLG